MARPEGHPLRVRMETVYQDRERWVVSVLSPFPEALGWIRTFLAYYDPRHSFKRCRVQVCVLRGLFRLSPDDPQGARGQCTLSCPPYARHVCFPILKSQEGLGKNAAGRMPNRGQSLVYSPGRMKAMHITNSFAHSSWAICCFSPLLRF